MTKSDNKLSLEEFSDGGSSSSSDSSEGPGYEFPLDRMGATTFPYHISGGSFCPGDPASSTEGTSCCEPTAAGAGTEASAYQSLSKLSSFIEESTGEYDEVDSKSMVESHARRMSPAVAPLHVDEMGFCKFHPGIQLRNKSCFSRQRVTKKSCPHCDEKHKLNMQQIRRESNVSKRGLPLMVTTEVEIEKQGEDNLLLAEPPVLELVVPVVPHEWRKQTLPNVDPGGDTESISTGGGAASIFPTNMTGNMNYMVDVSGHKPPRDDLVVELPLHVADSLGLTKDSDITDIQLKRQLRAMIVNPFPKKVIMICHHWRKLCSESDDFCDRVMSLRAMETLLNVMVLQKNHSEVQSAACWALGSIMLNNETYKGWLVECEGVKTILQAMGGFPDDAGVQEAACDAIQSLVRDHEPGQMQVVQEGGIELIINSMICHVMNASIQGAACMALANLACSSNSSVPMFIAHSGGLQAIFSAMDRHQHDHLVQEYACGTICNLVCNFDVRDRFIQARDICTIICAMGHHGGSARVQENASRAIQALAFKHAANKSFVIQNGGVDALLFALRNHSYNHNMREAVFDALDVLAFGNDDVKSLIMKSSQVKDAALDRNLVFPAGWRRRDSSNIAAEFVVNTSNSVHVVNRLGLKNEFGITQPEMIRQLRALKANPFPLKVISICKQWDAICQRSGSFCLQLVKAQGMEALLDAIVLQKDFPEVQEAAFQALGSMVLHHTQHKEWFAECEGVATILRAMVIFEQHAGVLSAACGALNSLMYDDTPSQLLVAQAGGIPAIIHAMNVHLGNSSVQETACMALANLACHANKSIQKAIIAFGGLKLTLLAMENHLHEGPVQESACGVLSNLFCTYSSSDSKSESAEIDAIFRAMVGHQLRPGVQENACRALHAMSYEDKNNQLYIIRNGGIEAIVRAMMNHIRNADVKGAARDALAVLAGQNKGVKALIDKAAERFVAASSGQQLAIIPKVRSSGPSSTFETECPKLPKNVAENLGLQKESLFSDAELSRQLRTLEVNPFPAKVVEICGHWSKWCRKSKPFCSKLVHTNGMEILLTAMILQKDAPEVQKAGFLALGPMVLNEAAHKEWFVECEGIAAIIAAMRKFQSNVGVQNACLEALRCFVANHEPSQLLVEEVGGISLILGSMHLHQSHHAIQEVACAVLAQIMTSCSSDAQKVTVSSGAIQAVVNAMENQPDNFSLQEKACAILFRICHHAKSYSILSKCAKATIKAAFHHQFNAEVQLQACKALLVFTSSNDCIKQFVVGHSGIEASLLAMKNHPHRIDLEQAVSDLLTTLAKDNDAAKSLIVSRDGIHELFSAMNSHAANTSFLLSSFRLLKTLIVERQDNCFMVADCGGIPMILSAMDADAGNADVQNDGCSLLESLTCLERNKLAFRNANGLKTVCRAMTEHSTVSSIQESSRRVLLNMASSSSESKCAAIQNRDAPRVIYTIY